MTAGGVAFVPLDLRPPYLVVLAILVCVQAFYANHLFDSSYTKGAGSALMLTGLVDKGKSEGNTLFYWIARNKPGNDGGFS